MSSHIIPAIRDFLFLMSGISADIDVILGFATRPNYPPVNFIHIYVLYMWPCPFK